MNLYEKIRNAECEIPEAFDMTISQAEDLIHNADPADKLDLVYIAFKFGYMQRCRTNEGSGAVERQD